MLKQHHAFMIIVTAIVVYPTFFAHPATAQNRVYVVGERPEVVPPPRDSRNWERDDDEPNPRVVKLRNGDIRLPNGDVVSARKIRKLRQGYMKLPNGNVVLPNGDIVSARGIVRLPNGDIRLPNGDIVEIDD